MAYSKLYSSLAQLDPCGEDVLPLDQGQLTKIASAATAPLVLATAVRREKVVSLFGDQDNLHGTPYTPALDWGVVIQQIRDVGALVRVERAKATAITQQVQSLTQGINAQAEKAERRAEATAIVAAIAVLRADRVEAQSRLAEKRAQQAEARALAAQADEKKAQLLLRRWHAIFKRVRDSLIAV